MADRGEGEGEGSDIIRTCERERERPSGPRGFGSADPLTSLFIFTIYLSRFTLCPKRFPKFSLKLRTNHVLQVMDEVLYVKTDPFQRFI
jgi:hypothetical protein